MLRLDDAAVSGKGDKMDSFRMATDMHDLNRRGQIAQAYLRLARRRRLARRIKWALIAFVMLSVVVWNYNN